MRNNICKKIKDHTLQYKKNLKQCKVKAKVSKLMQQVFRGLAFVIFFVPLSYV